MHKIFTAEARVPIPFGDEHEHLAGFYGAIEPPVDINPEVVSLSMAGHRTVDRSLPREEEPFQDATLIGSSDLRTVLYAHLTKTPRDEAGNEQALDVFKERLACILKIIGIDEVEFHAERQPRVRNF